jgi:hypothetical protein
MSTATIPASDEREAMGRAEDDAGREIANELEQQHLRWIVIYGTFTREFICLPRFAVPPGLKVVALYPEAAADRMSKMERLYRVREGLSIWGTGERTGEA